MNTELKEILPIVGNTLNDETVNTVNARDLHETLGVGAKYADWIRDRIAKYNLEEGMDFIRISGKSSGGRPAIEYYLTIDTAKELAMVQNNDAGRTVRRYFIEAEKALRLQNTSEETLLANIIRADDRDNRIHALATYHDVIVKPLTKKANYHDWVLQQPNLLNISSIAPDYGMTAIALNKKLQELGIQYKQGGHWTLKAPYIDKGLAKIQTREFNGNATLHLQWTHKGRQFIYEVLKKNGILPLIELEAA